jgi:hypothetical protein
LCSNRYGVAAELADTEMKLCTSLSKLGRDEWMAVSKVIMPGFKKRFGMRVYKWLITLDSVDTEHVPPPGQDRVRLREPVRLRVAAELADIEAKLRTALSKLERDEVWMAIDDPSGSGIFTGFRKRFGVPVYKWLETLDGVETEERVAGAGAGRVRRLLPPLES